MELKIAACPTAFIKSSPILNAAEGSFSLITNG
jgi:hypothetical protein